jgi:2-dehydropantoate 2-reductase
MHVDIDRGARLELEAFNGAVVRMGKELGVSTPVNQFLYTVLKPHINGAANP